MCRCRSAALSFAALVMRAPHGDVPPMPLLPGDESLRVHSAHGPLREMEILRLLSYLRN